MFLWSAGASRQESESSSYWLEAYAAAPACNQIGKKSIGILKPRFHQRSTINILSDWKPTLCLSTAYLSTFYELHWMRLIQSRHKENTTKHICKRAAGWSGQLGKLLVRRDLYGWMQRGRRSLVTGVRTTIPFPSLSRSGPSIGNGLAPLWVQVKSVSYTLCTADVATVCLWPDADGLTAAVTLEINFPQLSCQPSQ
jgi:hypothetical protein